MHKQASAESREGGDRDRDMRMKTEKKKKEKVCGVQVSLGYYLASHLSHFGIGRLPNSQLAATQHKLPSETLGRVHNLEEILGALCTLAAKGSAA